ncbi:transposase [Butyricicoccus porcorum]|uniref:Transposase InsH N-terminal domain-containing protein n=1 Tax=Butyricicoccus porcorum TaxID=1945634 RepID=A0A252F1F2_9FIRM|nr:hypothetical protein CBW42_12260 [Butyricicoccus porcorum]
MKQETFTDMEYSFRKKKTKREEFLEIMDEIIPWNEWVGVIAPYYPKGKRGRPPMGIEKMLRMYLLQIWFNLSDPATEDAIYDSYAMRKFTGIDFMTEAVPDETMLCKFRHLLEENGLNKLFFDAINRVIENRKSSVRCKVEHVFRIIKCQFGYKKTMYHGMMKNENRLYAMFACANLYALAIAGRKLSTT